MLVLVLAIVGLTAAWLYRDNIAQSATMLLMRNTQEAVQAGKHATVVEAERTALVQR